MSQKKVENFDHYLQPPRQHAFYQRLAIVMTFFSIGNSLWWGLDKCHILIRMHDKIFLSMAIFCCMSQVLYMYMNWSELSFRVLGTMYSIIPATFVVDVKLIACLFPSYKSVMVDLFDKIHIYNFLDGSDFTKMKLIQAERFCRWATAFLICFVILDCQLWIFTPIVNNIINKELIANRTVRMETCLYLWMPYDYRYNYKPWLFTHAMNVYLVTAGGTVLGLYDAVNYIFIFHFLGHIDILKHRIETYFTDDISDEETKERIGRVIDYHAFILRTYKQMEAAFGMNVGLNYAHNLIVDSLLLYQIMIGDKSNRFTYFIMISFHMGGLTLMSFALETVRIKAEDLGPVLYAAAWEKMSTSNQKLLIPILLRMQESMAFKAAGGLEAGVRPLISILKSTFSYYVMLKSSI